MGNKEGLTDLWETCGREHWTHMCVSLLMQLSRIITYQSTFNNNSFYLVDAWSRSNFQIFNPLNLNLIFSAEPLNIYSKNALPRHLEKGKNKSRKREKLPTKPRSKILENHFPSNGSIFHKEDAFSVRILSLPHW